MTFMQWVALIFVIGFLAIMYFVAFKVIKAIDKENQINEKRLAQEKELHDKEDENWRMINPALQRRIAELEATNRGNQQVIASLKYEIARKNEFLELWKLKDLYDQGYWPNRDNHLD